MTNKIKTCTSVFRDGDPQPLRDESAKRLEPNVVYVTSYKARLWEEPTMSDDELCPFTEVAKVYCHITNGLLSKHTYCADDVIRVADDCATKEIEDAERQAAIKVLSELREEYANWMAVPIRQYIDAKIAELKDE